MISEAIGFTKGALYHHFASKEELFKAVIDKHFNIQSISIDIERATLAEYTDYCVDHTRSILNKFLIKPAILIPLVIYR
jgi:AcrR family transcriptional regulator